MRQPLLRFALPAVLLAGILLTALLVPVTYAPAIEFGLLFLLLCSLIAQVRGAWQNLLLVAAPLVFGLMLIEIAGEILVPWPLQKMTPSFAAREPVLGWGPRGSGRFHAQRWAPFSGRLIYSADYTIDADLVRATQSCASCATLVFFGDSFTFGEGLNDAETLPQAFADAVDRKLRILNLGFPGYGPQQFLRAEEVGRFDRLIGAHPKLFVFLTAPWHAERTACKADFVAYGPRYALENERLVYKGHCLEGLALRLQENLDHLGLYRAFIEPPLDRLTHADVDLYIRILVAAVHLAEQKYGAPVLIPYMNVPEAYLAPTGLTNAEVVRRLKDGGALVVDASLAAQQAQGLPLTIPGDSHPTRLANRLRAAILKDALAKLPRLALAPEASPKTDRE